MYYLEGRNDAALGRLEALSKGLLRVTVQERVLRESCHHLLDLGK